MTGESPAQQKQQAKAIIIESVTGRVDFSPSDVGMKNCSQHPAFRFWMLTSNWATSSELEQSPHQCCIASHSQ